MPKKILPNNEVKNENKSDQKPLDISGGKSENKK